jgi:hypothetical protein
LGKKLNYLQFYDFCGFKTGRTKKNFSPSSFGAVVGSEIWDAGWIKINITDPLHYWKD